MTDLAPVTQADRQLVCDMMIPNSVPEQYRNAIMAGEWDDWKPIQIVAKHRLASTQPAPAFPREEVAKIIDPCAFPFEVFKTWDLDRSKRQDVANRKADAIAALLQGKQP